MRARTLRIVGGIAVTIALLAVGCSNASQGDPGQAASPTTDNTNPPVSTATPATTPTATSLPTPVPPTVVPEPTATPPPEPTALPANEFAYAIAKPRADGGQIPVFDVPGGVNRTLVDVNDIDRKESLNPLFAETFYGNPLVLRVIQDDSDEGWILVQVPTRPNHSHAWVKAEDFTIRTTNVSIEATTAATPGGQAGRVWVYRDGEEVFTAAVASGRDTRPTPLVTGWVGQVIDGPNQFGAVYGSWIVDLGTFSEALGTYGGGIPTMAFHGTPHPELIGERISSGAFRMRNEEIDEFVTIDGLLGAPVHVHEGQQLTDHVQNFRPTSPAPTTNWAPDAQPLIPVSV